MNRFLGDFEVCGVATRRDPRRHLCVRPHRGDGGDGAARGHVPAQKIEVPSATTDLEALTELPTTTTTTTAPVPALTPLAIRIPEVDIESPLIPLGLNPDNTLEVPTDFALAGWYIYRPVPGEIGPSVIAGHVDSKTGPAVFFRLNEVEPGAVIEVDRSDGTVAVFKVTARNNTTKTNSRPNTSTARPARPSSG